MTLQASYGTFSLSIPKDGYYSLWAEGKFMTKLPLGSFNTTLTNLQEVPVRTFKSIFRPNTNNMDTATIQLKYFHLKQGEYLLHTTREKESSLRLLDKIASNILPENADIQFSYRIKKTYPEFLFPVFMIALMFAIQGIVFTLIQIASQTQPN
ncbi:MAG: hypothetical protein LBI72_14040 [Flavobacteriaceae bacterium]|nr:hypothetical protein [Flavobacteriaceae bacterium]